jgi:hypothetical protein
MAGASFDEKPAKSRGHQTNTEQASLSSMGRTVMGQIFSSMNYGQFMGMLAVGGGLLIGLVSVIGGMWTAARKTEIDGLLKQDMLARGMSAEDIRTVLTAGKTESCKQPEESCV